MVEISDTPDGDFIDLVGSSCNSAGSYRVLSNVLFSARRFERIQSLVCPGYSGGQHYQE